MKKSLASLSIALLCAAALSSQEKLKSFQEDYYDFLSLDGYAARPYLNYRTLSDSEWTVNDPSGDIWEGQNLGTTRAITDDISFRVYGPELYSSYNLAAPYGQNDGLLWQGKGANASLSAGARLEGYGFELTLKPEVAFSQNLWFHLLPSAYESEYGYIWGYEYNKGADAPQRFGDNPFFNYSWGDSEVRYTWKNLTLGFGTQLIWLGPGKINSILHSNNAPPYPKVDFGLRRTPVSIHGVYLGDFETRMWGGYLSESKYFDSDDSNDHNLICGFSVSAYPSVLPGLTLSANRVYLAKWEKKSLGAFGNLLFFHFDGNGGDDTFDQRVSVSFDYLIPKGGIEFYGEAGANDNPGATLDACIRNFSHTVVYSGGFKKSVAISDENKIKGCLQFEWSNLEMSPTYSQFLWSNSFFMHHIITQGYTNEGQWIGFGTGTGGNSQYVGFTVFYPRGSTELFAHRYNPDNDYVVRYTTPSAGYPQKENYDGAFLTVMSVGLNNTAIFRNNIALKTSFAYAPVFGSEYSDWRIKHNVSLSQCVSIEF